MNNSAARQSAVILISGRGSNMLALIERSRRADSAYRVGAVFSDRADAAGIAAARDLGVAATALTARNPVEREAYDRELAAAIAMHKPDVVVLGRLHADFIGAVRRCLCGKNPQYPPFPAAQVPRSAHAPPCTRGPGCGARRPRFTS